MNNHKNIILADIQIVMVNTTLPANIGSAARAMHTMGLTNLTVINPKHPVDETSYSHAAGGTHILDNINIVDDLDEALKNSQLVLAASSRSRTMPRPVVNPAQAAKIIEQFINNHEISNKQSTDSTSPTISILFGREDRGLTNDELATAAYHIQIDANPDYPVLNVASAVQVIASFIYSHFANVKKHMTQKDESADNIDMIHNIRQEWDAPAINQQQQNNLTKRVIELMQSLELANTDDLGLLPQRLSRLTARTQLDEKEYQLLNAVVGKLKKLVK